MARIRCPYCRTVSTAPDGLIGRTVRCRICGNKFMAADLPPDGAAAGPVAAPPAYSVVTSQVIAPPTAPPVPPPVAARPRGGAKVVYLLLAAGALAMVVACGGAAVVFFTLRGRAAAGELYGGIDISTKAVTATLVQIMPDADKGYDYAVVWEKSLQANLGNGLDKRDTFDPDALREAVDTVKAYHDDLTKKHAVPPNRVFVAAGSGLLKPVRGRKDLDQAARDTLVQRNEDALAAAVKRATGSDVAFISPKKEVDLQLGGLVKRAYAGQALLIDVGSGATRGGYRDLGAGLTVGFEMMPGVGTFGGKIKAQAGNGPLPDAAARLADADLRAPLRELIDRKPEMLQRKRVYLVGGTPWVLATYQQPARYGPDLVPLTAGDIEDYAAMVRANPTLPPLAPPAGLKPDLREAFEKDVHRMRAEVFPKHEQLLAGAEILRALSAELKFDAPGKTVVFHPHSKLSWLLGYIAENRADKK